MRGQLYHFFVFIGGEIKLPAPYFQMVILKSKIVRRKITRSFLLFVSGFELKCV